MRNYGFVPWRKSLGCFPLLYSPCGEPQGVGIRIAWKPPGEPDRRSWGFRHLWQMIMKVRRVLSDCDFFSSPSLAVNKSCTIVDYCICICNAAKKFLESMWNRLEAQSCKLKEKVDIGKTYWGHCRCYPWSTGGTSWFFGGSFVVQETSCAWVLCLGGRDHRDTPYALRGYLASPNQHCWCFIRTFQICTIHM